MKERRIHIWLFAIFTVCVFAYLILGSVVSKPAQANESYMCEEYQGEWERVRENGTREPIQIPGKYSAKRNEVITIETIISEEVNGSECFCFRSAKQDIDIYVGDVLRTQYSTKDTRLFGKISAAAYVFLKIYPEDIGKPLRLVTRTDSNYSGAFYSVYYGNQMGIWQHFFHLHGSELIVALLILLLSIISIIISVVLRWIYHRKTELDYLGWGLLLAAVWLIANSSFRQLVFSSLSVANDIAFFMIMLLPLPYLIYMDHRQRGRYYRGYMILEGVVEVDFVVCSGLHMLKVQDFTDTIYIIALVCIFAILFITATVLLDLKNGYIKEYYIVAIGLAGAFVAGVVQIILYFRRTSAVSGIVLAAGLMFLLIFASLNAVKDILYIEKEKQQAILASEAKGRFLANMSHEIRTPINAVLGMDAMILRENTNDKVKEYAMDIQNAGQSLLALINDILDLSKIESGKMEIVPAEYEISSLIHDIVNMIFTKAETKGLKVELSVDETLPSRLFGDDIRIRQVLINLLNNAVKYTDKGYVKLTVNGTKKENTATLFFAVEDTGLGIQKQDLEKLFEEFGRIEETRNRNIEGTGLGMSITTQLLALMGSHLQVESTYGQGSKFFFQLEQPIINAEPIGDLEQRIREQVREFTYQESFLAPDAHVLVVDDNQVNRRVFIGLLRTTMVQVDEASDGTECLDMVREKQYDIIFLDHMMPGLDGVETLHQMKSWTDDYPCKSTPVIVLTANAISGAKEMYLKEGFSDFLSKPIDPDKLEQMLVQYLPEDKVFMAENTAMSKSSDDMPEKLDDLPEVEGIDWKYALLHVKDLDIVINTVRDFYYIADTEADKLEQQLHDLDEAEDITEAFRQYRVQVHSMKSSAAMVGAVSLFGVAKMLEGAAANEDGSTIQNVTPMFLDEWRKLGKRLYECWEEETPDEEQEKTEADLVMTRRYMDLLKKAMQDMDVDTADEIIAQLKRFSYPDEMTGIMKELETAVTNLDAEQTTLLADRLNDDILKEVDE